MQLSSNLTNKYNPQELKKNNKKIKNVQILPINTILKNLYNCCLMFAVVQILPINTILKNTMLYGTT